MKRKRHTEEQITKILKEAETGLPTVEIVRKRKGGSEFAHTFVA